MSPTRKEVVETGAPRLEEIVAESGRLKEACDSFGRIAETAITKAKPNRPFALVGFVFCSEDADGKRSANPILSFLDRQTAGSSEPRVIYGLVAGGEVYYLEESRSSSFTLGNGNSRLVFPQEQFSTSMRGYFRLNHPLETKEEEKSGSFARTISSELRGMILGRNPLPGQIKDWTKLVVELKNGLIVGSQDE